MASPKATADDEYTDYSCSTSIERLARDVETFLRSWHVDKGNDRHISMSTAANGNASVASRQPLHSNGSVASTVSTTTTATTDYQSLLLRSDRLQWTVSLTASSARVVNFSVELQLSLWDGNSTNDFHDDQNNNSADDDLPHSLRRTAQPTMSATQDLFENISSLFGIGQHITLTPSLRQQQATPPHDVFTNGELHFLSQSVLKRHDHERTARLTLYQVLSGWLQTALNCAVSNCHCCIPVFGFWGPYLPEKSHSDSRQQLVQRRKRSLFKSGEIQLFPSWMQEFADVNVPVLPRMSRKLCADLVRNQNRQSISPSLSGMVLPTFSASGNFCVSVLPGIAAKEFRLTQWASILLENCPDSSVVLWCARHVFGWWKQPIQKASAFQLLFQPDQYHYDSHHSPYTAWRRKPRLKDQSQKAKKQGDPTDTELNDSTGDDDDDDVMSTYYCLLEQYQQKCRTMAIALLDQAAAASATEPRWGPIDDPVLAIHATLTWNGSPSSSPFLNGGKVRRQPLLSYPVRIRSRQGMSADDWVEMEDSVERTILDPSQSDQCQLQTWWDLETPLASLAATQRCVLAALIRTSTLPDETLLKHVTDDEVIEQWDNASGNIVASCLAQQAQVNPVTKSLVDAMDWVTSVDDKMSARDADVLVRHLLQTDNGSKFPPEPTSPFLYTGTPSKQSTQPTRRRPSFVNSSSRAAAFDGLPASPAMASAGVSESFAANIFAPLFKSAPLGRLVSILFVHMARLRNVCSMSMLWSAFCQELRIRWEHRVALPHMNHVGGLDPSLQEMKERNKSLSTLGVKAEYSAFVIQPETEFPGDHHCLVGQKLQVVNLCIEMANALDAQRHERQGQQQEKRPICDVNPQHWNGSYSSRSKLKKKISEATHDLLESGNEVVDDSEASDVYADALSDDGSLDAEDAAALIAVAKRRMDSTQQFQHNYSRRGARCPVPGYSLVENGDQVYAPYLQRAYPLTDDVIAERHMMLSRHVEPSKASQHGVHKKLELSYRLQKPKLLSDMCAFKAANPGSIFQDFITWYGNPGNPLDEYNDKRSRSSGSIIGDLLLRRGGSSESAAVQLDKATEAIQMLNETREFWSRTWEEATPIPASEQKLLFDVTSTVEMAIDFMENMHPAILLNQVMAVNLAVSYFTLIEAAYDVGALKIGGIVQRAFQRFRDKTEVALDLLSRDATASTSASLDNSRRQEGSSSFASLKVISACDVACSALSDAEVITSRATSLLNKFPGQYDLVDSILNRENGKEVCLIDRKGQSHVLEFIQQQQRQHPVGTKGRSVNKGVKPALRDYILRNLDDTCPSQLSLRFADESVMPSMNQRTAEGSLKRGGGMIVALTKIFTE